MSKIPNVSTVRQLQREQLRRRLRGWADFPARRDPRPLVLLSPAVQAGSFPLDGKAKLAFERGLIQAPPGFPDELLHAMRHHRPQAGPPADPLQVATATQSVSGFLTDRGKQQLPAWEVHVRGVPEPIWVLDPSVTLRSWWPPEFEDDELRWPGSRAKLAGDQRTITLRFSGMPCALRRLPAHRSPGGRKRGCSAASTRRRRVFGASPGVRRDTRGICNTPAGSRGTDAARRERLARTCVPLSNH